MKKIAALIVSLFALGGVACGAAPDGAPAPGEASSPAETAQSAAPTVTLEAKSANEEKTNNVKDAISVEINQAPSEPTPEPTGTSPGHKTPQNNPGICVILQDKCFAGNDAACMEYVFRHCGQLENV